MQKCALYEFFHSKSTIFIVKICQKIVIFPTFQSQYDFKIIGALEIEGEQKLSRLILFSLVATFSV